MISAIKQQGFGTAAIVLVLVVVVIGGIIGWKMWETYQSDDTQNDTISQSSSSNSVDGTNENYETMHIMVDGFKIAYPLDENNEKVLIEGDDISYKPIRDYYAAKADADETCKKYIAGRLSAGTVDDLFEKIGTSFGHETDRQTKQQKVGDLISEGKAIKLGEVYVLAPTKQNETCTDIYENPDPKLQEAKRLMDSVQSQWLRSMAIEE